MWEMLVCVWHVRFAYYCFIPRSGPLLISLCFSLRWKKRKKKENRKEERRTRETEKIKSKTRGNVFTHSPYSLCWMYLLSMVNVFTHSSYSLWWIYLLILLTLFVECCTIIFFFFLLLLLLFFKSACKSSQSFFPKVSWHSSTSISGPQARGLKGQRSIMFKVKRDVGGQPEVNVEPLEILPWQKDINSFRMNPTHLFCND